MWSFQEVQLLITITDTLSGGLVDVIVANITQAVGSLAAVQSYEGIHGVATFTFGITVVCIRDFCGPDCNTLCVGRDDASGHFTCDPLVCAVCLPGFRNESSNCTDCALREGCCKINTNMLVTKLWLHLSITCGYFKVEQFLGMGIGRWFWAENLQTNLYLL